MKNKLLTIAVAFIGLFSFMAIPAYAADNPDICNANVAQQIKDAAGCTNNTAKLENVAQNIINVVLGLLGTIAVIFIIIGGINYMTSTGDAGKVQKAKNTILYAVIGLIVCALAAVIVNFTINAIQSSSKKETNQSQQNQNSRQ